MNNAKCNVIAALDLAPIKVKLMHKESGEGWSLEQVNEVEIEYRRFLLLLKQFPDEQVVPRFDVDIFWHYHILDTMKYAIDCEQIFGYFLHHYPYSGLGGEDEQAAHDRTGARTQQLYEATFGGAYIRQDERPTATEWQSPTQANTAWCNGIKAPPASAQSALSSTVWCNGIVGKPASYQPAASNTAWCNGSAAKPASTQSAPSNTAWCNGMMATPASSQSSPSNTAWRNGVMENRAWLQAATAIAVLSQAVAQNDSDYSHQLSAIAA